MAHHLEGNRIFCHSQNLFWTFEQLDVDAIEAPKVPSGMTGGVEYEAMAYAVSCFSLRTPDRDTLAEPKPSFFPTADCSFAIDERDRSDVSDGRSCVRVS